jgi:hypothetical protein
MYMIMTEYVTSNYFKAEALEPHVAIEAIIADVRSKEFIEKGECVIKPVVYTEDGRGLVLNQTRLSVLMTAYGPNSDNWLGKPIRITRGSTTYSGRTVPCVQVEAEATPRIASQPKRAKRVIESGVTKSAGSPPIDDDIPFMCEWR